MSRSSGETPQVQRRCRFGPSFPWRRHIYGFRGGASPSVTSPGFERWLYRSFFDSQFLDCDTGIDSVTNTVPRGSLWCIISFRHRYQANLHWNWKGASLTWFSFYLPPQPHFHSCHPCPLEGSLLSHTCTGSGHHHGGDGGDLLYSWRKVGHSGIGRCVL